LSKLNLFQPEFSTFRFSGQIAAKEKLEIVKERGEPACGRAARYGDFSSPPAAAKNVRTNFNIRSTSQRSIEADRDAYFEAIFTTGLGRPKPVPV